MASWQGFDISGHCFLLVFSNLFIVEEGKVERFLTTVFTSVFSNL
jgi:hypothetical protein